jgi:hypothetical protein
MSEPSEEKDKDKIFNEIVNSIDFDSISVKEILGDLLRSHQEISARVAVAILLLKKIENKNNDGVS